MKIKLFFYAFDYAVNVDGTVDSEYIHAATYQPSGENVVMLGTGETEFSLPPAHIINQSKIIGLESALKDYREASLAKIEEMQGRIRDLKALPEMVA